MSAPTMRPTRHRGKVGTYTPHVSRMATALSTTTRSAVAVQREIERAKALHGEMAVVALTCPLLREWYRAHLAPFVAAVTSDSATEALQDVLSAAVVADAHEDISLHRCATDPTVENKRRLAADIRLEIARKQDLLAKLEVS